MRIFQEIVIPKNLTDYCEARIKTVQLLTQSHKCMNMASETIGAVCPYGVSVSARHGDTLERAIRNVDRSLWRRAFDLTGFNQVMDKQAHSEFNKSLEENPPEFNEDNVRTIFLSANQEAEEMFVRGLVNIFSELADRYKSHSAFKINKKAIIGYMTTRWSGFTEVNRYNDGQDKLNDVDRVIKVLAGEKYVPRQLESAINVAWKAGEVYEDEYYRAKGFKNGNMHLEFKRQDLLDKANKIISEYYDGNAIPKENAA